MLLACAGCGGVTASVPPDVDVRVDDLTLLAAPVTFADVREVAVTPEGIWILDTAEPFVTLVTPEGEVGTRFGRAGRGPAELSMPMSIQGAGEGSTGILVWDPGNDRVTHFDAEGRALDVRRSDDGHTSLRSDLHRITFADPYRIRRVADGFAFERFPAGLARPTDLTRGRLMLSGHPDLVDGAPLPGSGGREAGPVDGELAALPLWDGCGGESIALWDPTGARLVWLGTDGDVLDAASVPYEARPLSTPEIENYLRLMARLETGADPAERGLDVAALARSMRDRFAREAPFASELRCGADQAVWLRRFDASADPLGRGRDWVVVRASGTTRVRLPESFSPRLVLRDRVVGVLEEAGGQRLAWWPRSDLPSPSTNTLE